MRSAPTKPPNSSDLKHKKGGLEEAPGKRKNRGVSRKNSVSG
ncbi:hypothetical protein TOL_2865 [Thalassolituus oleivorans MIL-1]|uniref:Uncharacterized protein n=1 Tax=Thalassolituus oleivorans MIL-1 TaxID=1298593 RepID=M5DTM5_9GAMM|nr:hypothetical protein TOL_2865 [Thalassolituus oleivorans MIL-1]